MKISTDRQNMSVEDVVALLSIPNDSIEYETLIAASAAQSRKAFGHRGYVFAQIGMNSAACSGNCKFCSLACDTYHLNPTEKSKEDVLALVRQTVDAQVDAVFLMTTADYPLAQYLSIVREARSIVPRHVKIIANIGDFTVKEAHQLKEAGVNGVYHIVRLREGIDTALDVATREQTLDALQQVGLELFYCVEPIGPEHSYEEIAVEILRAKERHVDVMACMKRVAVVGTAMGSLGEIDDAELTKIVAVSNLVVCPKTSMNVHEPNRLAMCAGVNQLYAELGANPRDVVNCTEYARGYSTQQAQELLAEFGYVAQAAECFESVF